MGEITDEMIAAGVAVLNRHTSDERRVLTDEEIVEGILRAALAAASRPENVAAR